MTKGSEATKKWREAFKARDPDGFKEYRKVEQQKRYAKYKPEINAAAVRWQKENPEKQSAMKKRNRARTPLAVRRTCDLKRKYGITWEQKMELLAAQGGRCCICGTDSPPKRLGYDQWTVDHCHKYEQETGGIKIRGILCAPCNSLLGLARDSVERLESAIKYLKKHNS